MKKEQPTKPCKTCGKTFSKKYKHTMERWSNTKYCSLKCRVTGKWLDCPICGKKFWCFAGRAIKNKNYYCSQECYHKSRVGKPNFGNPHKGNKRKTTCSQCKKELVVNLSRFNNYKRHFCNQKCWGLFFGKLHSGPQHYAWRGGKRGYPSIFNEQLKDRVRVRDNFKCQVCGIPELELKHRLPVHHIDYDKKNCDLDNLISLCKSCHSKTGVNREYWKARFQKQEMKPQEIRV